MILNLSIYMNNKINILSLFCENEIKINNQILKNYKNIQLKTLGFYFSKISKM